MCKDIDLTALRAQLPHGAIVDIAKRAKVNPPTVSRAMHGDKRSPKLPDIIKATADYLEEYKTKEKEAAQALKKAIA